MATINGTHADLVGWERQYGHPSSPYPLSVRQAAQAAGVSLPEPRVMLSIFSPPVPGTRSGVGGCCWDKKVHHASHCHVCGAPTEAAENLRGHAVAGFEDTPSPRSGAFIRFGVTHCREHAEGAPHCSRNEVTPGAGFDLGPSMLAGFSRGPGGYCEPLDKVLTTNVAFFPGAPQLRRAIGYLAAAAGLYVASSLALQHSMGQAKATLAGTTNQAVCVQNSTSGAGVNAGSILIMDGGAPANADAIQAGTVLISWVIPNPAFGAPSSALPSIATMNAVSDVSASATGTAGYGRMTTSASTGIPTPEDGTLSTTQRRIQFSVGVSSADMVFNTLSIVSAGTASMVSLTYAHPS